MVEQVGARKFELAGRVNACIAGLKPFCIGAEGMVGSRGMSACGSFAGLHPGGGLLWGHWPTVWLIDGCKPSRLGEVHRVGLGRPRHLHRWPRARRSSS